MDFIREKIDYNVAEFYERFKNYLPKTVIVNQGFCGEIMEDTFDREQVLRVQAISSQSRVTARFQYHNYSKLISIPLAYDERLCVVKHGNTLGKPKSLQIIVKKNTLPLMVQFPKDHIIKVGNQTISTNNIPCMELMHTFEEVYLLAIVITDGVIGQGVIHVPLYLSQLRLALITGIKGQSKEKFASYEQELDRAAAYIDFDQEFGNPNIAEYDPSAIHSKTPYSYVTPRMYSSIISIVKRHRPPSIRNATYSKPTEQTPHEEGLGLYEDIDNTTRPPQTANSKQPMQPLNKTLKAGLVNVPTPKPPPEKQNIPQHHSTPLSLAQNPGHKAVHTVPNINGGQVPSLHARRCVPEQTPHEEGLDLYEDIDNTARPHQIANSKQPMQPLNKTFKVDLENVLKAKPPQEKRNTPQHHSTPPSVAPKPEHKAVHTVPIIHGGQLPSLTARRCMPEQTPHEEGLGLYEDVDNTERQPQIANSKQPMQPLNKTFKVDLENVLTAKPPQEKRNTPQHHSTKPSVAPKPGQIPNIHGGQVPSLPARRFGPNIPKPQTESTKNPHAVYSNDVPRSTIMPMPHVKAEPIKDTVSPTPPALKEVKCFEDVTKLSIEDVLQYLEKLKLEQYLDKFKSQLIDGVMLQELNTDLLKEDFGMKGVEALRLMKFANEGHVPN